MVLRDVLPVPGSWGIQIRGSDVSGIAVARAKRGWYSSYEVNRSLSATRLARFFQREGSGWRVNHSLRSLIRFEYRNLLYPFADESKVDLILCRNVAIYVTPEVPCDLFERLADKPEPSGLLLIGSQESLVDLGPRFVPQSIGRTIVYRPKHHLAGSVTGR